MHKNKYLSNSRGHCELIQYEDSNLNTNSKNLPIRMRNLNSIHDNSVRLLIEGYILLWYLHSDQYIRDQLILTKLLSVVRHNIIINNIDSPSLHDQLRKYNSGHHKNDGYSSSGDVNLGTNTSISNNSKSSDKITHQFIPELNRLIFKKYKSFEGLLNWVFLRTANQLAMFLDKIMKEEVPMELYDDIHIHQIIDYQSIITIVIQ